MPKGTDGEGIIGLNTDINLGSCGMADKKLYRGLFRGLKVKRGAKLIIFLEAFQRLIGRLYSSDLCSGYYGEGWLIVGVEQEIHYTRSYRRSGLKYRSRVKRG